jgi:hypothetical protein
MGSSSLFAQGFKPPSPGKAVVYFCRVTIYCATYSFEYFNNDKYIGMFKAKNYLRYECDPGEQLFWATSENKEFAAADLKEGGTYIVLIDVVTQFHKPNVGFTPISASD